MTNRPQGPMTPTKEAPSSGTSIQPEPPRASTQDSLWDLSHTTLVSGAICVRIRQASSICRLIA
ncbi:hypothetical protein L227DRAFT_574609 [Lentinus tigrinus ALCF2SS1-6]|uniref:Uncharacterized protein n=1 Tax=Lentinus tigrinus ALCF2SS1-6 TaxID=1328759 RepID=A0A5C2SBA4_9APHY|nr:hypothetical protein L227DRAFT_574609 [Lentinus tigrinus ALCF2SS1-6]